MNNEITFGQFLWTFRITLRAFWKLFRTDHWKTAIILSMFRDTLTVQVDSFPLSLPPSFSPVSLSPPPSFFSFLSLLSISTGAFPFVDTSDEDGLIAVSGGNIMVNIFFITSCKCL